MQLKLYFNVYFLLQLVNNVTTIKLTKLPQLMNDRLDINNKP